VTIPASIFAAYIILGILLIGCEIENPFGNDVNDLPLDAFCAQIQKDIDVIVSRPAPKTEDIVAHPDNALLYPLSHRGHEYWAGKTVVQIREALSAKPQTDFDREGHHHVELKKKQRANSRILDV
jgi:hypothetical protein